MSCPMMSLCCLALSIGPALAMPRSPARVPTYTWVFLETGPASREGLSAEQIRQMQAAHLENLKRLHDEGKNLMAGPLGRESESIRGIVIMDLHEPAAIRREFESDPLVTNDYLSIVAHEWRMGVGRIGEPLEPAELGEYLIALIRVNPGRPGDRGCRAYEELEATLVSSRTVALAGPVSGPGPLCGVVIFRTSDREAVEETLVRSPDALEIDLYPQYLLKGQIDAPTP